MTTKYSMTQEFATPTGMVAIAGVAAAAGACVLVNKKHTEAMDGIDQVNTDLTKFKDYVNKMNLRKIPKSEMEIETLKTQNREILKMVHLMSQRQNQMISKIAMLEHKLSKNHVSIKNDDNSVVNFSTPSENSIEREESFDLSATNSKKDDTSTEILPLPIVEDIGDEELSISDIANMASM